MNPIAFAARELADQVLLLDALEVEPADIAPRRGLVIADLEQVEAARNLLPDTVLVVQLLA